MATLRPVDRFSLFFGLMLLTRLSLAQVTLDGTLGPAGPLSGPNYAIPAEVGQQHGGNLFHSFGQFSIHAGESATFSGPNSVSNIIGRVTGGQASTIDGLLRSTIPGANLYLLNPAGLLFGENARLDVSGSFHASTADYLRLGEGGRFEALTPGNSVLTVAPVEAFGFLGEMPGRIDINGSYLHGAEGQTLSLIGGDVTLTNATVYAPAGRLNVAAVGSAGAVIPTDTDLVMQGFGRLGTLTMKRDPDAPRKMVDMGNGFADVPLGDMDTSGAGGGALFIRGGEWVNWGGMVFADTYGAQAGRDVNVQIAGGMRFIGNARLTADTAAGDAGSITVEAGNLSLDGSAVQSATFGAGDAGRVDLNIADTLTVQNGGQISADTWGEGPAGDVTVNARNLLVDGMGAETFTGLASDAEDGTGAGGSVNLNIADTLTVQNGGEISAGTFSEGPAGDVTVSVGNLLVDGMGYDGFTGISSQANSTALGDGGNVTVSVTDTLTVQNGGEISAGTFSEGPAGDVTVNARNLLVDRMGAETVTGLVSNANSDSTGAGGSVNLTLTDTLTVQNGGQISADTWGEGPAGDVTVNARNLLVDGMGSEFFTGLASDAEDGTGAGGSVNLNIADTLTVQNGGEISAGTFSEGPAGDVTVNARNLLVDGMGAETFTGLASDAEDGTGAGGSVNLNIADTLTVQNGGEISAGTFSEGPAGDVTVSVGNLLVDGMGYDGFTGISSQANSTALGDGGNVTVSVTDTLTVQNGGEISAGTFSEGPAGDVTVNARNLLVDRMGAETVTGLVSNANSGSTGAGGSVNLTLTDTLTVQNGGQISADTWGEGPAGDVTVNARNLLVDGMGSEFFTGLASSANSGSTGAGGSVNLTLTDILTVQNGGTIRASTFGTGPAGDVTVNARNLLVDRMGAETFTGLASQANSGSTGAGGSVNLTLTDTLTVQNGGQISADTWGEGPAGDVTVSVGNLLVDGMGYDGFTGISSQANSTALGDGGNVTVSVTDTLTVQNGGEISAGTFSEGPAGDVTVNARNLLVDRMGAETVTGLVSNANSGSTGAGGSVNLTLADTLTVQNGGEISAGTFSEGPAGDVTVNARNLLVDGMGSEFFTGLASSANSGSTGAGGSVNLTLTDILTVQNGGTIRASTFGTGPAGDVTVNARNLLVDRMGAETVTGLVSNANSDSTGAGGSVNLTLTDTLTVQNGGQISADTWGEGPAGDVTVNARNLLVDGMGSEFFTGLASDAEDGTGAGGSVNLNIADTLTVQNGGEISAGTFSEGPAGDVTVSVGNLLVDGMGYDGFTGISSQANSTALGDGGNVTVSVTDTLTVKNDGRISVRSFSDEGNAGELKVNAPYLTLTDGGSIVATASDTTGGNVTINADYLKLLNGSEISSSAGGNISNSDGGNVTIHSTNIVALDGSTVTARAEEFQGGRIRIEAQAFLHDAPTVDDVLSATGGRSGNDGTVEVNAPTTDISGSLANLNTPYLDVSHHISRHCDSGDRDERSHFLIHGRGALPLGPDEAMPAPLSRCLPTEPVALASSAANSRQDVPAAPVSVQPPPGAEFGFNNR